MVEVCCMRRLTCYGLLTISYRLLSVVASLGNLGALTMHVTGRQGAKSRGYQAASLLSGLVDARVSQRTTHDGHRYGSITMHDETGSSKTPNMDGWLVGSHWQG